MLDQLLISLKEVCQLLLPVLGAIVLVYLIMFLNKLVKVAAKAEVLLSNVDDKVARLEKPLNTVESLCTTVDGVHEATVNGVNSAIDYLVHNFATVSEWLGRDGMA